MTDRSDVIPLWRLGCKRQDLLGLSQEGYEFKASLGFIIVLVQLCYIETLSKKHKTKHLTTKENSWVHNDIKQIRLEWGVNQKLLSGEGTPVKEYLRGRELAIENHQLRVTKGETVSSRNQRHVQKQWVRTAGWQDVERQQLLPPLNGPVAWPRKRHTRQVTPDVTY